MKELKTAIRLASFPLTLLILLLGFMLVYRLLGLPPSDELVDLARSYMGKYGYLVVFIGAFLEATPVVNFYLPGSTVVILAVAFSREGTLNVFIVIAVATVAFLLAYILDYIVGLYGWHTLMIHCGLDDALERAQKRVSTHGARWVWLAYVHPNVGAVAGTACGVLQVPLLSFALHSVAALVCWDALWGVVAYFGASVILQFADIKWLALAILIWLILTLMKGFRKR